MEGFDRSIEDNLSVVDGDEHRMLGFIGLFHNYTTCALKQ
jgi:hypothetical protein